MKGSGAGNPQKTGHYAPKGGGSGGNITKNNEMRKDTAKQVTNGHPNPNGMGNPNAGKM